MTTQTKSIHPGLKGRVSGFVGQRSRVQTNLCKRLYTLGLRPGAEFEVIQLAPLGDPIQIKVQGLLIGLRKLELETLQFELV